MTFISFFMGSVMFLKSPSLGMLFAAFALPAFAQGVAPPAQPLSLKECGLKYRAAKTDGSLGNRKWLDYRRSDGGIRPSAVTAQRPRVRSEASRSEALRRLIFPVSLAGEFSGQKPWEARMRTCLKSYREAKKAGTLYGVKWVEKGGGYYSECNKRLKGQG